MDASFPTKTTKGLEMFELMKQNVNEGHFTLITNSNSLLLYGFF